MNNFDFLKSLNDINIEIAKRVSARRKKNNITQEQLSMKSDVSYGSIKRFERTGEIYVGYMDEAGNCLIKTYKIFWLKIT